jgi:hypothetical protein
MGSIDLKIAALQNGSSTQATENAPAPKSQAASQLAAANGIPAASSAKAQQVIVSLSGTLPPQQGRQNAPSSGNAQPATFALLAHRITFPPDQNSIAAFTTAAFPPTATPSAGQNQPLAVIATSAPDAAGANLIATPVAQPAAGTQSSIAPAVAPATASTTSAPSTAPAQQTLEQLDRLLQQLGIDRETLSLISRAGMSNWVNDPAALRQIVRNVQAAAANPAQRSEQLPVAGVNQNQIQ